MSEMTSADLKTLERTPLFQTLPRRHRKRVAELATVKRYGNDEVIVRQDDPGDSFIVMLSGDVLVVPSIGGERLVVSNEYFGELSLIDGEPRAATVSAAGRGERSLHRPQGLSRRPATSRPSPSASCPAWP